MANPIGKSSKLEMIMRLLLFFSSILILLTGCESPTRGCLDVEATNFDVSRDKPCKDDCCVYPDLVCLVSQSFGGAVWKQDSAYTNNLGQSFRIKSVAFYLSDFQLTQNGSVFTVSDQVDMKIFGNNDGDTLDQVFTDDYLLVRRTPVEYSIGKFKKSGSFDHFQCKLGLDPAANNIVPKYAPSGHPLSKQTDSLWLSRNEKYVWMQVILTKNTDLATTPDTLRFTAQDFGGTPYTISSVSAFNHTTGFDFAFILGVDYAELFKGVDFANTGTAVWKSKMLSNLGSTFGVTQ